MFRPVLALALLPGCATIGTLQTANTLGRGNNQVAAETSLWGGVASGGGTVLPNANIAVRHGVTDTIDLGVRAGTAGIELNSKFLVVSPGEDGVVVSVAPSAGGLVLAAGGASIGAVSIQVPVIIGVPVGEHQLVLAPKLHDWTFFAGAGGSQAAFSMLSVGGSAGFALRVTPKLIVLPEFAAVMPFLGAAGGFIGTQTGLTAGSGALFQLSVGFLLGT